MPESAPTTETESTLRDITIQGTEFQIEVPYTEGHVLSSAEASQLNQVYAENVGNNFRAKVKEMLEAGSSADDIQLELDKYTENYTFGVRRLSGGGTRKKADPVLREMRALAKKALSDYFRKEKDIRFADFSSEEQEQAIKTYFERYGEKVKEIAERRIADAADMAAAGL